MPILHEKKRAPRHDVIPDSVRTLDALLNRRVLAARTEAEIDAGLRMKLEVKRRLVRIPAAMLDGAAVAELQLLEESA